MAKHYEVVTLHESASRNGHRDQGDGNFYTTQLDALEEAGKIHGGHKTTIDHQALRVPGGWYYLLASPEPVAVHGTWQFKAKLQQQRRTAALAKLTPEEIEALGLKIS